MRPPPGFHPKSFTLVCRLKKSLYGLRQAPHCWFSKLTTALRACGFHQSYADYSLFTYHIGDVFLSILIYVNDLLITGNSLSSIIKFKAYHMKDLGTLKYFLGLEVACNLTNIFLCQRKYTLEIIFEAGFSSAKPAYTLMEPNHHLAKTVGPIFTSSDRYCRLIGKLIYLALSCPKLAYAIHTLAQFMKAPQ